MTKAASTQGQAYKRYMVVQEATGSVQAFQESHIKAEPTDIKQEEYASADIAPQMPHTSVDAADNKQPDDIFGPAHEFD